MPDVPVGRTDSDLDDVWSDESGEVDRAAELTEFEFNPPSKTPTKKIETAGSRRARLTSDLEAPAIGSYPNAPLQPLPTVPSRVKNPTLKAGAVLEVSSSSSSSASLEIPADINDVPPSETRTCLLYTSPSPRDS